MTRRVAFVLVAVVVAVSVTASAQGRFGPTQGPGTSSRPNAPIPPPPPAPPAGPRADGPPRGAINPIFFPTRPLSPPGLTPMPVAQLMSDGISQLRAPAGVVDPYRVGPRFYRSRANRGIPLYGGYSPFGYGYPGYAGYADYGGAAYAAAETQRPDAATEYGFLRLDVQPDTAEVYIDGFYVGTVGDFASGSARAIDAGPHRVEIRAEGRQTVAFDVRVAPNETVSYRRDLGRAEEPRQARNVTPAVPKTFYVIPKCYAGDKPPTSDNLPKGCRASNVKRIPPPGGSAR